MIRFWIILVVLTWLFLGAIHQSQHGGGTGPEPSYDLYP